jgi:nucleoside-diphosphate-sugar epimerase
MSTIAVIGASGATGRAVTGHLLAAGHRVVAACRSAPEGLAVDHVPTDVLDPDAVRRALDGIASVVVTLGIAEHPLSVRLRGAQRTSNTVRSVGTANVVKALQDNGGGRLVVLSSYGVLDSAPGLSMGMRVVFAVLLRPQMRDHAAQEQMVRDSGLDWTIARPVNVMDAERPTLYADPQMRTVSMQVGRDQLAARLAQWATSTTDLKQAIALSS